MDVCVIGGAGYVGLVTGLGLAEIGHQVINVDTDTARIERLQAGDCPIYEEGIGPLLARNLETGRIRFSMDLEEGVTWSQVIFVAVGTPAYQDGQADLTQVIEVAESIATRLSSYKVVVIKSTVPVGTVELVRDILRRQHQEGEEFDIVSNPEFLREGKALYDFFNPDRLVIGACSDRAREIMRQLYEPIVQCTVSWPKEGTPPDKQCPIPVVDTDLASAQLIKYASNAFLATRISFINEIAELAEKVGADIKEIASGMGYDSRIGHVYMESGLGFGGPCLEKDLRALITMAEAHRHQPQLLRAVLERNDVQIARVIAKLKSAAGDLLYKKTVAVYGLAFKAGTSDVRNSLALKVIDWLEHDGAVVRAHDPAAIPEAQKWNPHVLYYEDPYEAVDGAEALLLLTDWPSFSGLDYVEIRTRMAQPCVVDARNLLDPEALKSLGFSYVGFGRQ